jgi:cob(I)alamin adenosyltransferase
MTKIYTKTGDLGETGLIGGRRLPKDDPRVAAYGDVDELNAVLGLARAESWDTPLNALLHEIQRDLFAVGAQLADPTAAIGSRQAKAAIAPAQVERLEAAIDEREAELPALTSFVLPGGSELGALLHLARTVCRRAERSVVTFARGEAVDPIVLVYLNRLSDLLFVVARHENHRGGKTEDHW